MKNHIMLGSLFALLSALCYAIQTSVIKMASTHFPVPILVFIQSGVCLLIVMPILLYRYGAKAFNPIEFSSAKGQHFIRTVFSMGISYFLFAAIKKISFFDAVLLYNTFPLITPFAALVILRTKINHALWPFILLGYFGVALTLQLDSNIFSSGALFAIASGLSGAFAIVMLKKISTTDDGLKSLYYYFLFSTVIGGVISIPFWHNAGYVNWFAIITIGILFFFVQYCLVMASIYTTPQVVSNLYYSTIIFSLILSCVVFHEILTDHMIVGMILIMLGGLGVIYFRNTKSSVKTAKIAMT